MNWHKLPQIYHVRAVVKLVVYLGTHVDKVEGGIRDFLGETVEQGGFIRICHLVAVSILPHLHSSYE